MAILTINEILYEFSKELGFESLNDNDFLKAESRNRARNFGKNTISLDKKWADLLQSIGKIAFPIIPIVFSKKKITLVHYRRCCK